MNLVRSLVAAAVVVSAAVPALSFAQDHTITRAEVRAELVQLQQAGYQPASDNTQYPANLQAALSRIAASQQGTSAAYGGSVAGSSDSGAAATVSAPASHVARMSHVSRDAAPSQDVPGLEPIYAHS